MEYRVVESKDGKIVESGPLSRPRARRQFGALKKLNASTGVVGAELYVEYSSGARRLIEAWSASQQAIQAANPTMKDVVDAMTGVFQRAGGIGNDNENITKKIAYDLLAEAGNGATSAKELKPMLYGAVIKACKDWKPPAKPFEVPGHPKLTASAQKLIEAKHNDVVQAIAKLMATAHKRNISSTGVSLIMFLLNTHGDAKSVAELKPVYFHSVLSKAKELTREMEDGKSGESPFMRPVLTPTGRIERGPEMQSLRKGEYTMNASDLLWSSVRAGLLRALKSERIEQVQKTNPDYAFGSPGIADPLFALYFRLSALANMLTSDPVLRKLALEGRVTASDVKFDRAIHAAGRQLAAIIASSAAYQIRRQRAEDGEGARTTVTGPMEQVQKLLDQIVSLLRRPGYSYVERIKAGTLAREATTLWATTLGMLPYGQQEGPLLG